MPFQPEDIAVKQFLVRARGYDRDEVAAFLRAVAADYRQALDALETAPDDVTESVAAVDAAADAPVALSPRERWSALITERRAADLLEAATRRLEEVAARERELVATERRVAQQLEAVRHALRAARGQVRTAAVVSAGEAHAVPA